jgi:hypothetical protein
MRTEFCYSSNPSNIGLSANSRGIIELGSNKLSVVGLIILLATVLRGRRASTERFMTSGTGIFVFTEAKLSLIEGRDAGRFSRSGEMGNVDLGSGISKMASEAIGRPARRGWRKKRTNEFRA